MIGLESPKHGKWQVWVKPWALCVGDHTEIGFGIIAILVYTVYWFARHAH